MHVVLDANIVISEGFGDSAHFRVLLSTASAIGHGIFIPALAIEEVVANFEKMLDGKAREVEKGLDTLSRHLDKPLASPLTDLDLGEEASLLRQRMVSASNYQVLDYPAITHEELVGRAVKRRKPFDERGSGYRDTLIWESVVQLADKVSDQVALVTSDKDFCDKEGNLHPDLTDELAGRGQCGEKIVLFRSLSEFINTNVRPVLKEVLKDSPFAQLTS